MRFWTQRLTPAGRALVICGVLLSPFSVVSVQVPLLISFLLLLFSLGVTALALNFLHRPKLSAEVLHPERVVAGFDAVCRVIVTNVGAVPAHDITVQWPGLPSPLRIAQPAAIVPFLEPGERTEFEVHIACPRRGVYGLPPVRPATAFPFRIAQSPRGKARCGTLSVVPAFHPLDNVDLPVSPRYQPGGIALSSNVGESPEYLGNREYRAGDSLRHIDFRAWARLSVPAVREYQEEYYCRLLIVLDTQLDRRWGRLDEAPLDAVLSLGAALADCFSRGEFIIDIVLAGSALYRLRTGRHTAQLDHVLDFLASVEPAFEDPFEEATALLADQLPRMSAMVLVLNRLSESRNRLVRLAEENGCRTKILRLEKGKGRETAVPVTGHPIVSIPMDSILRGKVNWL